MLSRLYTLLLVVAVAWSSCYVFGAIGIIIFAAVFTLAAIIATRWSLARYAGFTLIALVIIALLLPAVATLPPESLRRYHCGNNLKQISMALISYRNSNQSFPPVYVAGRDGKPMHSWRVLILPYLGEKKIYNQYDFNEPWNGPNNKRLLSARPAVYMCPADEGALKKGATDTNYVAVVGLNAAWRDDKPRSIDDPGLREYASTTVVLSETAGAGINWTEPRDLSVDALKALDSLTSAVTVSSKHGCYRHDLFYDYESDTPYGANVATIDGKSYFHWLNPVEAKELASFLEIGRFKEDDHYPLFLPERQFKAKLRLRTCAAFAVWCVSVALLLHQAWRSRKNAGTSGGENAGRV